MFFFEIPCTFTQSNYSREDACARVRQSSPSVTVTVQLPGRNAQGELHPP